LQETGQPNDRRDRWVAYEYAEVRWLHAQLAIPDFTTIELFNPGTHHEHIWVSAQVLELAAAILEVR